MTEKDLRSKIVAIAEGWLGRKEADGSHREIIDVYNSHKPLARGYAVKYTDAWCSTFASAVAIKAGYTDIIPTECGCEEHIKRFQAMNAWVENDAYVPEMGDYIFYDWQDTGTGDNTGRADHVGIVVSCDGKTVKVIEGNKNDAVEYRTLQVNGKYIRGYGVPDYASKADKPKNEAELDNTPAKWAKEAVEWATANGIMLGDDKGDLKLHAGLTREEYCVMLHRTVQKLKEGSI